MACVDPVELPDLDRELRLFRHRGATGGRRARSLAPFALDAGDYTTPLAPFGAAPTRIVTNLRAFGYVFNPVSFFVRYESRPRDAVPVALVAEVNNTYGGRHCYALDVEQRIAERADSARGVGFRAARDFFVSPFLHGALGYDFWLDAPLDGARLAIEMHVFERATGRRALTARFAGTRTPLSDRALLRAALRFPLMTAQVTALIHWQALKLHVLGAPYRRPGPDHRPHDDPRDDPRDVPAAGR